MSRGASPNRAVLEPIARRLGPLLDEVVFVGGQVAELLVTDRAAVRIRATDDVDIVVPVLTRTAYHRFGSRLRALGFREDTSPGAPMCRWCDPEGGLLDAMPVEGAVGNGKRSTSVAAVPTTAARTSRTS